MRKRYVRCMSAAERPTKARDGRLPARHDRNLHEATAAIAGCTAHARMTWHLGIPYNTLCVCGALPAQRAGRECLWRACIAHAAGLQLHHFDSS